MPRSALSLTWSAATTKLLTTWLCTSLLPSRRLSTKTAFDQNLIETERRVAIEKARENGKPEHLIEKIAEGSVNKFLKEVTLLSQPFVKDDSKSVGELLKSNGATVSAFALFVVGEGLEKRNDDFAAEVAAQAAAARA